MEKIAFVTEFVKSNSFSFIALMILSVVIMLVSNLIFWRKKSNVLASIIALVSIAVAFCALANFYNCSAIPIAFPSVVLVLFAVTIVFGLTTFYAVTNQLTKLEYFACCVLYYVAVVFSFFVILT